MLPVSLPELDRLAVKVSAAKAWHDKASKIFVRKGFSKLLEVSTLYPNDLFKVVNLKNTQYCGFSSCNMSGVWIGVISPGPLVSDRKTPQVLSPRGSLSNDNRPLEESLRESTAKEFTEMKKRRGANMLRTEQEEKGMISEDDNVYCICRRG